VEVEEGVVVVAPDWHPEERPRSRQNGKRRRIIDDHSMTGFKPDF